MKKVITAIHNPDINKKLSKNKNIKVICRDILYQEAIFEILEKNNKIDFLILSSELPGEENIENIILKINKINEKIKIICFFKKGEKIVKGKIYKKYLKEQINVETIEKAIFDEKNNIREYSFENKKNKKIIFLGNKGSGKSVILANIALYLSKKKIKTIILDFDINKTNYLIFNLNNKKILNKLIYINSNLYYLEKFNLLKKEEINKTINILEKDFDIILIDTSGNFFENEKKLITNSDEKIFITEANISELKKSKILLEKYKEKNINSEKFKIILNKNNLNSIDDNLIRKILKNKIIGKIKYSKKYNLLINEKIKEIVNKKEIQKIIKNMEVENKIEFRNKFRTKNESRKTINFFRDNIRKSN